MAIQPHLVCRPALPQDTQRVIDLSRLIWGGGDYLHLVWDEWLKESDQVLAVAEYAGRLAGCGRLCLVSPGEYWLEGLRVHPDFRGRGFAHHIQHYLVARCRQMGGGIVRLLTAADRKPVMHMMDEDGFSPVCEMTAVLALAEEGEAPFLLARQEDAAELLASARQNRLFPPQLNLMDAGWKFAYPCERLIEAAIAAQRLYHWRGRQGWIMVYPDESEGPKSLFLSYVCCPPDDLPELARDARRLAGKMQFDQAAWNLFHTGGLHEVVKSAGYEASADEDQLILFEKFEHSAT